MIAKIRTNGVIINIYMPKVNSINERIERTKRIKEYERFLTKLFKK